MIITKVNFSKLRDDDVQFLSINEVQFVVWELRQIELINRLRDVTPSHITSLDVTPSEVRTFEVLKLLDITPSGSYTFGILHLRKLHLQMFHLRYIHKIYTFHRF